MSEHIEIWDRVFFDEQGEATHWLRSMDGGETWQEVDCSMYGGKPPFLKMENNRAAWIEQHNWMPEVPHQS